MVGLVLLLSLLAFPAFGAPVAMIAVQAAVAGAVAGSWLVFGAALVLGALSYAMTPRVKPKSSSFTSSNTVSVRQSDLTRQHVYGHTRITRGYAQIEKTDTNGKLHIILMLCEGELRAINEIWVEDYVIPNDWIDSSGNVTEGRYAGFLQIKKNLGSPSQTADSLAVANMPEWTSSHRLQGIAYIYFILTKSQDVYPNGVPNFSAIVEGPLLLDPRTGVNTWTTNIPIYCADFIQNTTYGFGAFDDDCDLDSFSAQANIGDEIVDFDGEAETITAVDTSTDILTLDADILPYEFGDRVEVASTGSLPSGLSAATAYYVIPYQVKGTPRFKLATSLANAMAKTAINITSAGSGTITIEKTGEPRYHGGGVFDTEANLSETLNNLAACMAGRAINVAGRWSLLAGAYRSAAVDFTIDDIREAQMTVQTSLSMSDSFNLVKGSFFSQLNNYQPSDYPAASYGQFVVDDNGIESPKELNLPFVGRPTTCQRIAKIELFRGRQGITVQADFSMKALQVQTGDTVSMTIDRYGWTQKEFEVTRSNFYIKDGGMFMRLSLRETAQAIYDWSEGEAITYDPAPNSNLPDYFNVTAPEAVSYSSREIGTAGGDSLFSLTMAWEAHPDAFVREFGDFELQFKLSSEADWRPSFFVDGGLTQTGVVNASVNTSYDLRIRARNNLGVRSGWVTIEGAIVGYSGGVGSTDDWGSVADAVATSDDWGSVADAVTTDNDWGYVV